MSAPALPVGRRRPRLRLLLLGGGLVVAAAVGITLYALHMLEPRVDGRSAEQLRAGLAEPDPGIRRQAATDLGRLNTHGSVALPELAAALTSDPDAGVRAAAAEAVGKMAPASERVVDSLAKALTDRDPWVRMNSALALLLLKEKARPAVPALTAASNDLENDTTLNAFHHTIRQAVLTALGEAAAGTPEAVPTLVAVLDKPSADGIRRAAVAGLGRAGEHSRGAAPKVRRLLDDPNEDVRIAAADALDRMGVPREGEVSKGEYDDLELPDDERERLWDIEHRVNVLNKYGLVKLSAAVKAGDEAAVRALLAADFAGSEPGDAGRVTTTGFAAVDRRTADDKPLSLTAPQFAARLMGWRKLFADSPSVSFATATLTAKDMAKPDGPWEGTVLVRLAGTAAGGGVAEVSASVRVEVTAASEEALAGTGWLRAVHVKRAAVARSPGPLFADVAAARGLNVKLHDNWTEPVTGPSDRPPVIVSGGVYVCDFDRDGYLDVLIVDLKGVALYRGKAGGKFDDITTAVGLPTDGAAHAACWADLDGDGWDDLILGDRVFRNADGTTFEDVTARTTFTQLIGLSALVPADFDRDGKLDLYLTRSSPPGNQSWLDGTGNGGQGNRLLRNMGGWRFDDVTKTSGTHGGYKSSFTAAWLDADDDGWPDLHVPNEFGDGDLYVNQRDGTFKPTRLADRPADFGTMGLAAGDLNNDGRMDLYCADMYSKAGTRVIGNLKADAYPPAVMAKLRKFVSGSELHLNRGGGHFTQVGVEKQMNAVGWAYGPALADFDGDGFLDVFGTAGYLSRDRSKPDG
jgi:HEAT repeat protein